MSMRSVMLRLVERTGGAWAARGSDAWILVNVGVAVGAALFGVADLAFDVGANGTELTPSAAVAVVAASLAVVARRAYPMAVLVFISLARLAVADVARTEIAVAIPAGLALYAVVRSQSRLQALLATVITLAAGVSSVLLVQPVALAEELISETLLILLVLAVAELLRTLQARTEDRIEAAAAAQVQAERLRIARDLHDVVAHSLSNIAIQSGVAARLLKSDPDHAERALEIINDTGRSSLDELRSFLGLLRSEGDAVDTRPTPHQPADLDGLFDDARVAGIDLEVSTVGRPPENPSAASTLAVYRIVQESLTNISRHAGPVQATIEIVHADEQVTLSITNQPGVPSLEPVPSTGVGILGMKERAEAVGGHLDVEPCSTGEFRIAATLPYHRKELGRPS